MKIDYKKILKSKFGFTLVEVIIAFGIMVLLIAIFSDYIMDSYRTIRFVDEFNEAVENAKSSINIMNQEIREASKGENGSYAIGAASGQEIIFYSDFDHDNETEKIRYYLDGASLKKDTTEAGALQDYGGQAVASILSEYVESAATIFTYYDEESNLISDPSANINKIRLIHIYLEIKRTSTKYIIETNVHIRNLKTNY